VTIIILENKMN